MVGCLLFAVITFLIGTLVGIAVIGYLFLFNNDFFIKPNHYHFKNGVACLPDMHHDEEVMALNHTRESAM